MPKEWSKGICGCTANVPWCVITFCFPCVTSYSVANKIGKRNLAVMSAIIGTLCGIAGVISSACAEMSPKMKAMQNEPERADQYETDGMFYGAGFFGFVEVVTLLIFIVIVAKIRSSVREHYDVGGDSMSDCLLSCFCNECVLCQMYNHVDFELTQGGGGVNVGDDKNVNIERV